MTQVTLDSLNNNLHQLTTEVARLSATLDAFERRTQKNFDDITVKLVVHDDLLHLIADTVSRHDDDLTYLKRTLRHQRV